MNNLQVELDYWVRRIAYLRNEAEIATRNGDEQTAKINRQVADVSEELADRLRSQIEGTRYELY